MRGLEEQLGAKVFQRRHRQVVLTEAGERFHADVSLGLSHIRKSAEDLRLQATGGHVTLAASTAFGSFWMMPRLQQFRDELPGIDLRIQTADRDLDIIAEGIPLGVRGGEQRDWPDYHSLPLADEEIFPVAGTSYAAKFGLPKSVAELATHRLIHLEEPYREAASWDEWFVSAGASLSDTARGLRINDYGLVIQGVMEGQGIALGWRHLAERLLASGLLVPVTDHVLRTGKAFYVVWPKNRELSDNASKVRDWLAAQA
ncbi:LysR family transcriptional regulator [Mesorhizobium sp. LNHC252B00]|nr:LysR family transcriptional regulator [Mesorhizobium sp. LNHC252B00]